MCCSCMPKVQGGASCGANVTTDRLLDKALETYFAGTTAKN